LPIEKSPVQSHWPTSQTVLCLLTSRLCNLLGHQVGLFFASLQVTCAISLATMSDCSLPHYKSPVQSPWPPSRTVLCLITSHLCNLLGHQVRLFFASLQVACAISLATKSDCSLPIFFAYLQVTCAISLATKSDWLATCRSAPLCPYFFNKG